MEIQERKDKQLKREILVKKNPKISRKPCTKNYIPKTWY